MMVYVSPFWDLVAGAPLQVSHGATVDPVKNPRDVDYVCAYVCKMGDLPVCM